VTQLHDRELRKSICKQTKKIHVTIGEEKKKLSLAWLGLDWKHQLVWVDYWSEWIWIWLKTS